VGEIDEQPVGIATIKPVYPFHARRRGTEGYVTVQFLVDRAGEVQELSIVEAKPSGVFERSVRKTVPRWRFRPGKKDGRAVETWVRMTIRFELGNDA
jgi:protein TonB